MSSTAVSTHKDKEMHFYRTHIFTEGITPPYSNGQRGGKRERKRERKKERSRFKTD